MDILVTEISINTSYEIILSQ